ncbi:MAG: YchF/TatD family DNA exonuclease [Deltaproteobacteria bacterium]|nr:YchF/TatD family DNA exonuclease [Deltaproteobacteria bacterium]
MFVDAHCHLERATYADELDDVIARAFAAGLSHLVAVGASGVTAGAHEVLALCRRYPRVRAAVGIHPHDAAKAQPKDVEILAGLLERPEVVALGEIGLDYHYDFAPPAVQRRLFERLLGLARDRDLPAMLHVREADADVFTTLDAVGVPKAGGVVHCFTGGPKQAEAYLSRGLHLSIPGVITFKNAEPLRDAVRAAPLERLLVETDSPYLAPVPYRGKRNEPAFVLHTAAAIAALKGLSTDDVGRVTAQNARRLFGMESDAAPALAYPIRDNLYVNLTSRCTLACTFCPKIERKDWWVRGHWLRLGSDPEEALVLDAVLAALDAKPEVTEIVFVGLGEPTLRLAALVSIGQKIRARFGARYRLRADTDGLGNLVHGRDITAELATVLDAVSVSLNAADGETYARLCHSRYGAGAYGAVKQFIAAAKAAGLDVTASVVGVPGLDLEACRVVAEEELGVRFRHRVHQQVG